MQKDHRLVIIGGSGRNVGKTEFTCRLIEKFAAAHTVYALKVSTIFPDEELFHGDHQQDPDHNLFEETRRDTRKDTSRMLRAGATRVFYLRCEDSDIARGFQRFQRLVPDESLIICESNSLADHVRPGLLIMVKTTDGMIKPRIAHKFDSADLVVISDMVSGFPELDCIHYDPENRWYISARKKRIKW